MPRRVVREVGVAFLVIGLAILLFAGYELFGTNLTEQANQRQLRQEFQKALAAGEGHPAAPAPPAAPGIPTYAIDHLVIPKINLSKYVVEGVDENDLTMGPGHYPQTVLPGQLGNSGIAGHRTTYGAPFFELNELAVGDMIEITDLSGTTYYYAVAKAPFAVDPTDVAVLDPTPDAELTLTTCTPRYTATQRLIVVADLTSAPAAPPSPPPQAPPRGLAGGNTNGWPGAILWGGVVALVVVATRILSIRTRRLWLLGSLVGGVVLSLAPLWLLFENVARILPASY